MDEAVRIIRAKVCSAIAEAYPALTDECRREAEARGLALGEGAGEAGELMGERGRG